LYTSPVLHSGGSPAWTPPAPKTVSLRRVPAVGACVSNEANVGGGGTSADALTVGAADAVTDATGTGVSGAGEVRPAGDSDGQPVSRHAATSIEIGLVVMAATIPASGRTWFRALGVREK